jgi:hypothetical protein
MDLVRFAGVSDNSDNEALVQAALSFLSIRARRGGEAWSTSKIIRWKHITPVTGGVNVKINTKTGFYDLFFPELPGSPICFVKRLETLRSIGYSEPGDPVFADRKGNLLKQQQVADYVAKCHRRLGNHNPLRFSAKSCMPRWQRHGQRRAKNARSHHQDDRRLEVQRLPALRPS